jgi:hypothetical protein
MEVIFSFGYRNPDKAIVKEVKGILEGCGHDILFIFVGPDVEPGDKGFKATWTKELLIRKVCVCFISPEYLTPFCLKECAVAKAASSVKRLVVLLCSKEEVLPLLENIVEKGTIPLAVDLYTDLATANVQFVCIGETDPAKIADKLDKIFVKREWRSCNLFDRKVFCVVDRKKNRVLFQQFLFSLQAPARRWRW